MGQVLYDAIYEIVICDKIILFVLHNIVTCTFQYTQLTLFVAKLVYRIAFEKLIISVSL